jgi:C-terminal processing protease CtpA/Prc
MIGRARKHKALIVDLRGNGGGSVETLEFLVRGIFGKDLKIADRDGRKPSLRWQRDSTNPTAEK